MKKLEVPFFSAVSKNSCISEISSLLDELPKNHIEQSSWPGFDYIPRASFTIGYSGDCIFIKYYITEDTVRALFMRSNEPVYKDSCVEFFLAFEDEVSYYNFEFNCIGTCLSGYGADQEARKLLPENLIEKIRYQSLLKKDGLPGGNISWELALMIPLEVFHYHRFTTLKGLRGRVNFFKCGDDLPKPHYLSWNVIESDTPNFHLSGFFGQAHFI